MQFIVETGEGLTNATSYSSTLAADDYATFWDKTEWLNLGEQDKERYLIQATRILDTELDYPSQILKLDQALGYPRKPFQVKSGRTIQGIPDALQEAAIRLAIILARGWKYDAQRKVLKAQSYGSSSETYMGSYVEGATPEFDEWRTILKFLSDIGLGGKSIKQVELIRG